MRLFTTLWKTDRPLTATVLLMGLALAMAIVGLLLDPRIITGAPAWLKPAKFAVSIGIYTLTLAWIFRYLQDWVRTRRIVSWTTAVTLVLEIVIIDIQAWRGTTSHFNVGTWLDGILFTVMGTAILVQTLVAVALCVALWKQRFADPALGWALRLAIVITLIGASTGGLMVRPTRQQLQAAHETGRILVVGSHTVGAPDGGPGLPGTGWSIEHGDLRIAHFLGLHALQALPLFALFLVRLGWNDQRRTRVVVSAAASYFAMFSLLLSQALRGESIAHPDATTVAALVVWAIASIAILGFAVARAPLARTHATV